jgi:hypothetical protein
MNAHRVIQMRLVGLGLALLFAFPAVYVAAFDDPSPHGLRVGVVGGPAALQNARAALDPERFDAVPYSSQSSAIAALRGDRVRGALTLAPDSATVAIASAYGMPVTQAVKEALTAAAARTEMPVRVVDVRPLPHHDSRGLSPFFTIMAAGIASLLFAVLLTLLARPLSLRHRLTACLAVAALGGLVVAFTVEVVVGALDGSFLGVAGILALFVAGVVLCVHGLGRLAGPAGLALGGALFLLVGTSSTGGGVTYQLQPAFYRAVSQLLPNGAAVAAVRNEVYFGGGHMAGALAVLGAWAAAGLALLVIVPKVKEPT